VQDSGNRVDPVRRYTFSLRPLWLESEREVAFERKNPLCRPIWGQLRGRRANSDYSTVTDLARFRGWSTSQPRRTAMRYASN
jgi:hypothetical protein